MKRHILALCLCIATVTANHALASDWSQYARSAPADTDILMVIENASVLRSGPVGKSLAELFSELIPMTATMQAWSSLATRLDLPPDEAFDALLGNRVLFIGRRVEDEPMQWAIESEIPSRLAYRLLRKLGARPRDIKSNHPIAMLEENRFQLTYQRHGDVATMIFAPTASESLFNDLIARLNPAAGGGLADTAEFIAAVRNSRTDAAIFSYVRRWETFVPWFAATATIERAGVHVEFAAASEKPLASAQPPISLMQWRTFSHGALLAFVDRLSFDELTLPWVVSRFGFGDFTELMPASLSKRIAMGVYSQEPGQLAATLALETDDLGRLAQLGDAVVAQLASTMQSRDQDNTDERESFDLLKGEYPQVMRSVSLADYDKKIQPRRDQPATTHSQLFWSYPFSRSRVGEHGWWVIANHEQLHDRTINTLIQAPSKPVKHASETSGSYLLVRPADLLKALVASDLLTVTNIPPPIRALERIRLIEGRSFLKGDLLHGRLKVKLGPASHDR